MIRYFALHEYVTALFEALGCSYDDAYTVASALITAELRDVSLDGLSRIALYHQMVTLGRVNVSPDIRVVYQTPSTATLDGDNSFGAVAGRRAMELAIRKAQGAGSGWVAVRRTHHLGIGVYFTRMALENDMIGIVLNNTPPVVAPVNGTSPMLGSNPISVAIPALNNPPIVYDFNTIPITPARLARIRRDRAPAPDGVLQDALGKDTADPSTLLRGGSIRPLGGDADHGAHKGFCVGSLVDIFSSILAGANFGPFVPHDVPYVPLSPDQVERGTGCFVGAIRIDAFRPAKDFKNQVDEWIDTFRFTQGKQGSSGIQIAGEPERIIQEQRMKLGLRLDSQLIRSIDRVARDLNLPPLPYTPDDGPEREPA